MHCLQNFTIEEVLSNHKKQCLLINECQTVNYESVKFINFKINKIYKPQKTNTYII